MQVLKEKYVKSDERKMFGRFNISNKICGTEKVDLRKDLM